MCDENEWGERGVMGEWHKEVEGGRALQDRSVSAAEGETYT